jgi:hypothetical protein
MRNNPWRIACLFVLASLLSACGPAPTPTRLPTYTAVPPASATNVPTPVPTAPAGPTATATAAPTAVPITPLPAAAAFATYHEEPVTVRPAVPQEPIAPDLSNVVSAFLLSPQQRERLAKAGFVVSPAEDKEFYVLYEQARYNYEPILITSDSLLHVYHLIFDKTLRTLERERFIPALKQLNARMLQDAQQQYEQLRGTSLEGSARRHVAFFAVGSRLLDPGAEVPAYARDLAEAELALIDAHDGIHPSPIFPALLPYGEDYTQYIPRGHYTLGEDLKAYFRSMMWYGRMTFRIIKPEDEGGREETRRALLIVQALASDAEAQSLWQSIYEPTVFFVGRSDDLLYSEYLEVMARVYGGIPAPAAFADEEQLTRFMQEGQKLRPPRILGIVLGGAENKEEATKGFRFMGQRFVPDSYIFGQLIEREVPGRHLPKGLDLLAVMGSERAYAILEEEGDTGYISYTANMAALRQEFATLTTDDWTQNLYWSWLYLFFPLLEKPGPGYPVFVQSPAWLDKSLNAVLGSWAELRHDTILYAKQVYAERGGEAKGPPPEPEPPKGYVEPLPGFYARLAALSAMTREGLQERGLVQEGGEVALAMQSLQDLEDLSLALKVMAEKELAGQPLSEEEYQRIRYFGGDLEQFTFAASDEYRGPWGSPMAAEEPQAAVVADVATNAFLGQVLEEGVGRISAIYAVVPIEGQLVIAKGGVFSYYEFPWPMDDRLTDEKWREMLDGGQAPPLPEWTSSFRVEQTEEAALRAAVWGFNQQWIAAAWVPDPSWLALVATGAVLGESQAYVQSLLDQGLYEGYHLVRLEYLSFDLQDAGQAIVTTRETWWEERYGAGPDPWSPGPLLATRPEYTIGVVYHLERGDGGWLVSQVLVQGEVPAWQEVVPQ